MVGIYHPIFKMISAASKKLPHLNRGGNSTFFYLVTRENRDTRKLQSLEVSHLRSAWEVCPLTLSMKLKAKSSLL